MLLTDLAVAARKSGLSVVEVSGWRHRGHGVLASVDSIVCHHTATSRTASGDYPSIRVVRDGRPDLDGPLANLGLGRNGTVYVIAAGVAYHAGATRQSWMDNWHSIGIEAEADGLSSWPAAQMDAYARLCAALCEHYAVPVERVLGHKEVCQPAGRKSDPNFDMAAFRRRVAAVSREELDMDEKTLRKIIREEARAAVDDVLDADMNANEPKGDKAFRRMSFRQAIKNIHKAVVK